MISLRTWIVLVCLELANVIDVGWYVFWPLLVVVVEYIVRGVMREVASQPTKKKESKEWLLH